MATLNLISTPSRAGEAKPVSLTSHARATVAMTHEERAIYIPVTVQITAPGSEPLMVDKTEAARRCGMSAATYDKYAKRGLLPALNAVGRVSIEALKCASMKLDGLPEKDTIGDPAERALRDW
jgi:hypothetical protein